MYHFFLLYLNKKIKWESLANSRDELCNVASSAAY